MPFDPLAYYVPRPLPGAEQPPETIHFAALPVGDELHSANVTGRFLAECVAAGMRRLMTAVRGCA